MTFPTILFGIFLSTLYGAAFHFWRGGDMRHLLVYLVLGWVGFWAGQYLGGLAGITFGQVGGLYLGAATLVAGILLFGGYYALKLIWREE